MTNYREWRGAYEGKIRANIAREARMTSAVRDATRRTRTPQMVADDRVAMKQREQAVKTKRFKIGQKVVDSRGKYRGRVESVRKSGDVAVRSPSGRVLNIFAASELRLKP